MLKGYKIAGICMTRLQDEFASEFLQALNDAAVKADYRLLVYHSFTDFSCDDESEAGAKSIYKLINFDIIDILLIADSCFHDKQIVKDLIKTAKKKNIPVVVLYGEYKGCFCIHRNYADTYKALVSHLIDVHQMNEIYYIDMEETAQAPEAAKRLDCFCEVMAAYGIALPVWGLACCDDYDASVGSVIKQWVDVNKIPQAIVCANDVLAASVCDCLNTYGLKVPKDVLVIGFGGQASLRFHQPRITTCAQDMTKLAGICLKMIRDALENELDPYREEYNYSIVLTESCGCRAEKPLNYREEADRLSRLIAETRIHEEVIFTWADHIRESTDLTMIGHNLVENILPASSVVVNSNLLSAARLNEEIDLEHPFTDKVINVASRNEDDSLEGQEIFDLEQLYPRLADNIGDHSMHVLQAVYADNEVCGYYIAKVENIMETAAKLHRLCRIINLDFGVVLSRIRQEHMATRMESLQLRDAHTGFLNMKGLIAFINEDYEEYSQYHMAISIYAIQRYRYILETFGLESADEIASLTAEALQLANPNSSLIARISDDEFIIVNLIEEAEMIGPTIDHATSTFFPIINEYNRKREKDFNVEVNCGCVVSEPGWENDLLSFIKAATGEMYLNKMKYGNSSAVKQESSDSSYDEQYFHIFDILIKKNLFSYHFQPIVDARTGKIYAYEALMRTDEEIGLKPDQILDIAGKSNRLYDVECATMFNVLGFMDTHLEEFAGRRVFINTIPGCFLKDKDYKKLVKQYGHLFGQCTIELIEKNETTDAELMQIKCLESNGEACQLAIDDYGTGFSNIVNLLRYQPQVIKLDRFLITDVHNDTNKQLFISNTVEFAKLNDIRVLAEGVETKEELSKVIELGVDYIQGFYTARPSAEILQEIDKEIVGFIVKRAKHVKEDQA